MTLLLLAAFNHSANAQQRPRQDVIDVPADRDGLSVSNVFQSGMVIQRDKPVRIWGWAEPGEQIEVDFAERRATAVAADDRRWQVELPSSPANAEPQTVSINSGADNIKLDNVLIGDVWLLGGQSNMEFELAKVENGALEIVSANYPKIRILTVPYGEGPKPKQNFARLHEWSDWFGRHFRKGDWNECRPEVARELSAIGYVFARRIHKAADIPIGVIDVSRGGTTVETWTPLSVLKQLDSDPVRAKLQTFQQAVQDWDAEADLQNRIQQHQRWVKRQTDEGKPIPKDRQSAPTDLRPGPIADHNYPGHCYAGMIQPLAGLSVCGAVFHQGYNNTFDGSRGVALYRDVFPEMIRAWRDAFNDDELPFGILSLCTDGYPQTRDNYCEKMFDAGIDIRAVQYDTFRKLFDAGDRNVGFVSTYDLRRRWYHPQLKIPAGERVARWALATQYGFEDQLQWEPPTIDQMEVDGNKIVLHFRREVGDPEDGLIAGFAIAGQDRRFHPADVRYAEAGKDDRGRTREDRRRLVLTSPMVSQPIHYRYAWGRNPLANLQATGNKDLPVATQRSDDWAMETVPRGVVPTEESKPFTRADRNRILQALRQQDRDRRVAEAQNVLQSEAE